MFAVVNGVRMNHVAVNDIKEGDWRRFTRADRDDPRQLYGVELNVKIIVLRRPTNTVERVSRIGQESIVLCRAIRSVT
jgi:hypothetical protein